MSGFTVKTQQRGPVLTMVISVMRSEYDYSEYKTDDFNINDLALVTGKLKPRRSYKNLQLVVRLKKTEAASNLTVTINISSEGTVKTFLCRDEWVEVSIKEIYVDSSICNSTYIFSYTVKVDFTIHATMPHMLPPTTCKQLYEDTEFTDFKLLATDGTVAVHKSVLSIHGEMFRTMLRGQWKETAEDSINMDGVSVQTLQHLKDFMYLGTLPDEGLGPLVEVARRCLMDNLMAACIDKLISTVKPETFDGLVELAIQYNVPELVRKLVLEIPDNIVNEIQRSLNSKQLK